MREWIRLEEGGIVTRCELTTYEPEGLLDLTFIDQERVQRLIMKVRSLSPSSSPLLSHTRELIKRWENDLVRMVERRSIGITSEFREIVNQFLTDQGSGR